MLILSEGDRRVDAALVCDKAEHQILKTQRRCLEYTTCIDIISCGPDVSFCPPSLHSPSKLLIWSQSQPPLDCREQQPSTDSAPLAHLIKSLFSFLPLRPRAIAVSSVVRRAKLAMKEKRLERSQEMHPSLPPHPPAT